MSSQEDNRNSGGGLPPAPPIPAAALEKYVKSHDTNEIMELIDAIRIKIDRFMNNRLTLSDFTDLKGRKIPKRVYLERLSAKRKRILGEIRRDFGALQIKWIEHTAGYKSSSKTHKKAFDRILFRANNVLGTVDTTKQASVNYASKYLVHFMARVQSSASKSIGDHLSKTEEWDYKLEQIKVQGIVGQAGRAGILAPQNEGLFKKITPRFLKKKK